MGIRALSRAVFLDRDGVVNEAVVRDGKPYPPHSAEELVIPPDAADALKRLKHIELPLIVVTNQPDVARGKQTREAVAAIHRRLAAALPIDHFLSCFHDDADHCACRKPLPGLIFEGAALYGADPGHSFVIGDRWRDIDAGAAAGCTTIMIDRHYRERLPLRRPDVKVTSLSEAADWIVRQVQSDEARE